MPVLLPTDYYATITWLGYVPHRDKPAVETIPLDRMVLDWGGYAGDIHSGVTRPSCSRVLPQFPRGTEIANARALSITCADETAEVAAKMGLDQLRPDWLGTSIELRGIPDFSYLPPSARLQAENGTTLVVDLNNRPCQFPAKTIEEHHPGFGEILYARGRRIAGRGGAHRTTRRSGNRRPAAPACARSTPVVAP